MQNVRIIRKNKEQFISLTDLERNLTDQDPGIRLQAIEDLAQSNLDNKANMLFDMAQKEQDAELVRAIYKHVNAIKRKELQNNPDRESDHEVNIAMERYVPGQERLNKPDRSMLGCLVVFMRVLAIIVGVSLIVVPVLYLNNNNLLNMESLQKFLAIMTGEKKINSQQTKAVQKQDQIKGTPDQEQFGSETSVKRKPTNESKPVLNFHDNSAYAEFVIPAKEGQAKNMSEANSAKLIEETDENEYEGDSFYHVLDRTDYHVDPDCIFLRKYSSQDLYMTIKPPEERVPCKLCIKERK